MELSTKELEALDAPLIALVQRCGGDLRRTLHAVFSFLHRRTDFYLVPHEDDLNSGKARLGFKEGDAERVLLTAFRQFPLRRLPRQSLKPQSQQQPPESSSSSSSSLPPTQHEHPTTSVPPLTPLDKATKSNDDSVLSAVNDVSQASLPNNTATKATPGPSTCTNIRYTKEGRQIPVGNGGTCKTYTWTQSLHECNVMIGIPAHLRAKDLSVVIQTSSLSVTAKRSFVGVVENNNHDSASSVAAETHEFVKGNLTAQIIPSESTWSLEGGGLMLTLCKKVATWWETVLVGDESIDTSLVDSRQHIDEYDDATQAQIRKIIHQQSLSATKLGLHPGGTAESNLIQLPPPNELGRSTIPPLPPGVEYINQQVLDQHQSPKQQH